MATAATLSDEIKLDQSLQSQEVLFVPVFNEPNEEQLRYGSEHAKRIAHLNTINQLFISCETTEGAIVNVYTKTYQNVLELEERLHPNIYAYVIGQYHSYFGDFSLDVVKLDDEHLAEARTILKDIMANFYSGINSSLNPEKLEAYYQQVCQKLDYYVDPTTECETKRHQNVCLLNGSVGGGKETTLKSLEIEAITSGTEGIAGRGGENPPEKNRYSKYEYFFRGFDLCRADQMLIPNNIILLLLANELEIKRAELDGIGLFNDVITVSGLPRNEHQANLFKELDPRGVTSIYLWISENEAAIRTIKRMIMKMADGLELRPDDINSLNLENTPTTQTVIGNLKSHVALLRRNGAAAKKAGNELTDYIVVRVFNIIGKEKKSLKLHDGSLGKPEARYHKDDKAKEVMLRVLKELGIETAIIDCNGLAVEEVTHRVGDIIKS